MSVTETQTKTDSDTSADETPSVDWSYTPRLSGFALFIGLLVWFGVVTTTPLLVAAAIIPLIYIATNLLRVPNVIGDDLVVAYRVTPTHPRPGDRVDVTVTVENTGDNPLVDVRLVDFVPEDLDVVEGAPRATGPVRAGGKIEFTYTVRATRGQYTFDTIRVRHRALLGAIWNETTVTAKDTATMRCAVTIDDIPLEDRATHFIGDLLADTGGEGTEFYATREYHRGDSPTRINWRELAKHGSLSTITFRETQAAEIGLILDARWWTRHSHRAGMPTAATLGAYAAYQVTASLVDAGHYVSLTIPGLDPSPSSDQTFPCRRYGQSRSDDQKYRLFTVFEDVETVPDIDSDVIPPTAPTPGQPDRDDNLGADLPFLVDGDTHSVADFVTALQAHSSESSQYVFVTPLLDDSSVALAHYLRRLDYPAVVISPDTIGADSETPLSQQATRLYRALRVEGLRTAGLTVIDWNPNQPLAVSADQQTLPSQ